MKGEREKAIKGKAFARLKKLQDADYDKVAYNNLLSGVFKSRNPPETSVDIFENTKSFRASRQYGDFCKNYNFIYTDVSTINKIFEKHNWLVAKTRGYRPCYDSEEFSGVIENLFAKEVGKNGCVRLDPKIKADQNLPINLAHAVITGEAKSYIEGKKEKKEKKVTILKDLFSPLP